MRRFSPPVVLSACLVAGGWLRADRDGGPGSAGSNGTAGTSGSAGTIG